MPDPRFYKREGPFSLRQLAEIGGCIFDTDCDGDQVVKDVAGLSTACHEDVSFFADSKRIDDLNQSSCGVCVVSQEFTEKLPEGCTALISDSPQAAFARIATAFYLDRRRTDDEGPSVAIHSSAQIADTSAIAPGVVIGADAIIGNNTIVGENTVIGSGVVIGDNCKISASVTLIYCLIGNSVTVHPGVRVGQDGFGFVLDDMKSLRHLKIPQLGRVIIYDDVEIGANTAIDRGALGDTIVGEGCKIDNLVQIGHNVELGKRCVVVSQAGIAGSCRLGDDVLIGGQAAIADHVTVGSKAQIAGKSGVIRNVPPGEKVMGYPAKKIRQFWREIVALASLTDRKG